MSKKETITVQGTEISLLSKSNGKNYICITDIARYKNPDEPKDAVKNWMRNRSTIEFLGLWEKIHNPDFKGVEFDPLLSEAGSNAFTMSPTKCKPLSEFPETVLQGCKPLSADSEAIYTQLNISNNIILYL
ncbi:MAG: KilA-N domain-containing protein [Bacteroidales bacterium]|jgi:hypothetical protein|nr:KilA-N domain-containing protein [Bacteroidales bacterium]